MSYDIEITIINLKYNYKILSTNTVFMKNIAFFASGSGSNVENIIRFFTEFTPNISFFVFTNNKNAGVINRCINLNVPFRIFNKDEWKNDVITQELVQFKPDLIVLAGFLWLVPSSLIKNFPNTIINIHPALLPNYGGKGMYGDFVHKKVIENNEKESGITIHYVNENYDEGNIIFQAKVPIQENDSPEILAQKIHELEYKYFPEVIKGLIEG